MSNALKAKIKQQADFGSPVVEGMLNLLVAADAVRTDFNGVLAAHNLTQGQYNVLRILRGAGGDGHPRGEIATRMIERAPDVTRIIDRLEKQKLVERGRSDQDRRHSVTRITDKGLELLEQAEPDVLEFDDRIARKLSPVEWVALTSICEKIYGDQRQSQEEISSDG